VRRVIDLVGAFLMLIPGVPLMLLAALAIRLDDGGPCLYRQERVGKNGRRFILCKLRTMRTDAEADGQARWAANDDPRVTRVGRLLRQLRIDELPQLYNVIRGEMSLIGPRPERACFVEALSRELPRYALRLLAPPGLTGYAQVRCGYSASLSEARDKLACDLYYLVHQSLALDLVILTRTVAVVLTARGAR
jgi:lipopolysaccharide/colanic/teichoic acid biosynthesis glycosyltransferase